MTKLLAWATEKAEHPLAGWRRRRSRLGETGWGVGTLSWKCLIGPPVEKLNHQSCLPLSSWAKSGLEM